MHNLMAMAILHSADNLLKEPAGRIFRHLAVGDNVFKEFAAGILDDHYYVAWSGDNCIPMMTSINSCPLPHRFNQLTI